MEIQIVRPYLYLEPENEVLSYFEDIAKQLDLNITDTLLKEFVGVINALTHWEGAYKRQNLDDERINYNKLIFFKSNLELLEEYGFKLFKPFQNIYLERVYTNWPENE